MRNAHRQQAKNAYDRMNKLVPDYAAQLLKVTTFLVVTGDQAEEFAKAAEENAGCFIYNIENMFSDLTGKIAAINYVNRGYSSHLALLINGVLMQQARELDMIKSLPSVPFKTQDIRVIKDDADFNAFMKHVVVKYVGGDYIGLNAVRHIADAAIKKDFAGNFFPLVLYTKDESLNAIYKDLQNIGKYSFNIFAGTEKPTTPEAYFDVTNRADQDSVMSSLKKIRAAIKKLEN